MRCGQATGTAAGGCHVHKAEGKDVHAKAQTPKHTETQTHSTAQTQTHRHTAHAHSQTQTQTHLAVCGNRVKEVEKPLHFLSID